MRQSLRKVLLPTLSQTLGCLFGSMILIAYIYRSQIWQRLYNGQFSQALGQINYGDVVSKTTSSPIVKTAVIVAFWSAVGLVAYTVVWSLINVLIEARNEVVLETEYTNRGAVANRLRVPMIQLGLAVLLFVGLYFSAKVTLPIWLAQVYKALSVDGLAWPILHALIGILGLATNIYLLVLMGQLVFWVG